MIPEEPTDENVKPLLALMVYVHTSSMPVYQIIWHDELCAVMEKSGTSYAVVLPEE